MATPLESVFEGEVRLSREMTLFSVTMIGVGAMIGAGIFVLTGIAAGIAGPALVLVFLLNGVVTLFTAMAYAELGSCFHDAGGGYLWIKEGLRQPNGFLAGWMSWFAHAVACSLYALGFGAYFGHVLTEGFGLNVPNLPFPLEKLLAVLACFLFAYVNYRGASETGKAGNIVTMAKILVIGLFIAFGFEAIAGKAGWQAEFRSFMPNGMGAVFMAMGLTFIAFQGYEVIAQCSEEVINPRRNIPRAVFLALLIVIPIYVAVAVTALGAVSGDGMPAWQYLGAKKEIAMVEAARQFMPGGAIVFMVGGLLSTLSALNATIYSSSRVAFAMARDANLPDLFSRVHLQRRTPHFSILASVIIVVSMAVLLPVEDVASAADIMFLLVFMQVNLVVIRLRSKMPKLDRGFRIPLMPLFPVLGIGTQMFVALYLVRYSPKAFLTAAAWILAGIVIYYKYASRKEASYVSLRQGIQKLVRKEYRILVPLGNSENVRDLMAVSTALARYFDGELVALSVIEVPFQTPLVSGAVMPEVKERRNNLRLAERLAEQHDVPCRRIIKISHRLSEAVLETAREEECNFIVLGRSPRPRFGSKLVRSFMDHVLGSSPCHVAVVKPGKDPGVIRVVAAVEDDHNSRLALELLPAFAAHWRSEVLVLALSTDGAMGRLRGEQLLARMKHEIPLPKGATASVAAGLPLADAVLGATKRGDLIVMGESPWTGFSRLLGATLPDEIAAKTSQMAVFVKSYRPRRKRSLVFRLLTGA